MGIILKIYIKCIKDNNGNMLNMYENNGNKYVQWKHIKKMKIL